MRELGAKIGERVFFEGYPGEADEQLNPKHKIWEAVQPVSFICLVDNVYLGFLNN